MMVLVLTGGIGSGKSTAAQHLRARGAVALDLDEVAESVLKPDSPVLDAVVARFGAAVLRPDGTLDRAALAGVAFTSPEAAGALDHLVHPAVATQIASILSALKGSAEPPRVIVVEVPLLAEAPWFVDLADVVLAISAPEDLRISRAALRGDMTEDDVRRRLAVQAPDEAREALADFVIVNDGSLERFLGELDRFWNERVAVGDHE
ncbi:MAG: dephospho-CoA kinase [Coriobacteriia bacterium]|nr:dephospho-CoA kinase [Coriobacteriia bacterium]